MKNLNNKKKKNVYFIELIIISALITILLISTLYIIETISAASSAIEFGLGKDGLIGYTSSLDAQTKKNLENIYNYAKNNFQEVSGSNGYVKIENGEIIIFNSNNEQFAKIPKGYEIRRDLKKFIVKNNGAGKDSILEIEKNRFKAEKGGEVSWNKETREISGKNTELLLSDGSELGAKEFSGKFDEKGNLKSLSTVGFSKYTDKNRGMYFAENLNIYKDGTAPESVKGNTIFFGGDKDTITLKGIVQSNNGKGLNYNGYSENTLTKYDPNTNIFDVKGGDVGISNGENTVTYKNEQANIGREGLISSKNVESFTVRYQDENGKIITTTVDKTLGTLFLSSVQNGKTTGTAIVPLDIFEGSLNNVRAVQEDYIGQMEKNLEQLKSSGSSKDKIDALELVIANAQNRNNNPSDAIDNINKYLDVNRDSKSEINAKIALAELYAQRAANPEIPIGTSFLDWEKTARLQSVIDYQASIDTYKSIKESSSSREQQEAASFGLAEVYRKSGDSIPALQVYNDLVNHGSSIQTISNAELGIAQIHLDNNDPRNSIISLDNALSTNPRNIQAQQLKESIIDGIYKNIQRGLGNQLNEFEKAYEEKLGLSDYKSLLETPGAALKSAFLNTGEVLWNSLGKTDGGISAVFMGKQYEISQAQLGTSVFETIRREGYSDTEFANLDLNGKKEVIAKTYGLIYVDENKIKQAFIEDYKKIHTGEYAEKYIQQNYLNENGNLDRYNVERDNFITKLYGQKVLRQDKLVYDMASAAIEAKQKIYDLDLITDSEKLADRNNPDFKFKIGEGYIDPENLKITWKDSVLNQINLVNAGLTLAPGATLSIAGRTMTVAGWIGTGARAIPGVEAGIEGINTARIGAAEMLGLKAVAEAIPKTAATGGFVSRELANFQVGNIIIESVPGGQYIAPFVNINPSTSGLRTASEVLDDISTTGAKITLRDFVRVEEGNGQFVPRFFATFEDMQTISSNARRLGLKEVTDIGVPISPGVKIFEIQSGKQFLIFQEDYIPSITTSSSSLMSKPKNHYEMLDLKYSGATAEELTDATSYSITAQQVGVGKLTQTSKGPLSIRGMTSDQIQEMGIKTRSFYTVTSENSAERLKAGGVIETAGGETFSWPTAPNRAHIGSGFYSWDNLNSAVEYKRSLESRGIEGLKIVEVQFSENALSKFKTINVDSLGKEGANQWLNQHSFLFTNNPSQVIPHQYEHVIRGTNFGKENYFPPDAFQKGTVIKVLD